MSDDRIRIPSVTVRGFGLGLLLVTAGALLLACGGEGSASEESVGSPVVQSYLKKGTGALRAQEFRTGLAMADSAAMHADHTKESADVAMLRGRIHSEMGQFEEAEAAYQRALEHEPDYPGVRLNLGNNAYRRSQYREAIDQYRVELERHPGPAPWRGIGRAYVELGAADSAETAFQSAIRRDSTYAPAYHSLALLYEDQGRFDQALRHARRALGSDSQNVGFEYQVGALELRSGNHAEALRHLVRVVEEQPWHQGAHYNIGQALARLGHQEKAKEFMDRAEDLRQLESKIQHLQSTVRSVPDDPYAHAALGSALRRAGRNNDAMHAYKTASYLAPDNTDIRNNIANLYLVRNDTSRAIEEYRAILRRDSSLVDVWVNLGVVYALSDEPARARSAWKEALRRDAENERARSYLERLEEEEPITRSAGP